MKGNLFLKICFFSLFLFSTTVDYLWELNHHHGLIQLKLAHDDDDGFINNGCRIKIHQHFVFPQWIKIILLLLIVVDYAVFY